MYAYLTFDGGKPSLMPEGGGRVAEFSTAESLWGYLITKVSQPIIFVDGLTGVAKNAHKLASILDDFAEVKEIRELLGGERHTVRAADGTVYRVELCAGYAPGRTKRIIFVNFDEMATPVDTLLEKFNLDDQPGIRLTVMQRYRALLRQEGLTSFTARKNAEKELLPLYEVHFPKLPEHVDNLVSAAYRGGIMRAPAETTTFENVDAYDFRGLYSSIYADKLPTGQGTYKTGDCTAAEWGTLLDFKNFFSVIRFFSNVTRGEDSFLSDMRMARADGSRELLTLTGEDIFVARVLGYEFNNVSVAESVSFDLSPSPFSEYAKKWEEKKANAATWAQRSIAKKMLNVPAGAFGSKTPLRFIPAAAYITAEGRGKWLTAAAISRMAGASVIYGNTDSLHLCGSTHALANAAEKLREVGYLGDGAAGKLSLESSFSETTYRGINLYAGKCADGGEVVKAAGLPLKNKKQLNYDKFKNGCEIIAEYGDGSKITWRLE